MRLAGTFGCFTFRRFITPMVLMRLTFGPAPWARGGRSRVSAGARLRRYRRPQRGSGVPRPSIIAPLIARREA